MLMRRQLNGTGNNRKPASDGTQDHSNGGTPDDLPNNVDRPSRLRSQARREANVLSQAQRKEERERLINQAVGDGLSPREARNLYDEEDERIIIGFEDEEIDDQDVNNLYQHNKEGESFKDLSKKQLADKCAERGLIKSGTKTDLLNRLSNPQPSDFKKKPKVEQWKNSKAKALLIRLLMDKSSPIHNKTAEEAWESSDWFKLYPKDRFIVNMRNLKGALAAREKIVENDNSTIAVELATIAGLGESDGSFNYPVWWSHEASKFIEADLKAGVDQGLKPRDFQQTRQEYLEFPLHVFRDKIYAEKRKQREMKMKVLQRNKIAERLHRKEVEAEQARWHAEQDHDETVNQLFDELSIH